MNRWHRHAVLTTALAAPLLIAADQTMDLVPGKWRVEVRQQGGATYKDSHAKDGSGRVEDDRVVHRSEACLLGERARMKPERLAEGCAISEPRFTAREFTAKLTCTHPKMAMTGSLRATTYDAGRKLVAMQILHGGGAQVGAVVTTTLTMTRMGDCTETKP